MIGSGPLRAGAKFLFLIASNFKAVIAKGLKLGISSLSNHCSTLAENFASRLLSAQAWLSHTVKNRVFYVLLWSSTISVKNIATLSNVGFL